jgi:ferric-dicitrate binding protein FerR (iron transport regulator)
MSLVNEPMGDFERNARTVLEASVSRIDARTRSRLNQARHAALEAARRPRRAWWRSLALMPAAGAVAAALLMAVVLWHHQPGGELPGDEPRAAAVEDMDLLADSDGIDLMEGWDGSFYEWAAAQSDAGAENS